MKNSSQKLIKTENDSPLMNFVIQSIREQLDLQNMSEFGERYKISRTTVLKILNSQSAEEFYKRSPRVIVVLISKIKSMEISQIIEKYNDEFSKFKFNDLTTPITRAEDEIPNFDFKKSSSKDVLNRIQELFSDPLCLKIYYLAKRKTGVSISELTTKFGESYIPRLDDLKLHEMLLVKNDVFYVDPAKYIQFEREQIKKMIPILNSYYDKNLSGQDRNFITFRQHTINRKTQIQLINLHTKFMNDMANILENPDCIGEIPFYSFSQAGELY